VFQLFNLFLRQGGTNPGDDSSPKESAFCLRVGQFPCLAPQGVFIQPLAENRLFNLALQALDAIVEVALLGPMLHHDLAHLLALFFR
jgi:hypothetical protein